MNDDVYMMVMPSVAEVLDSIKNRVNEHKLMPYADTAAIVTPTGERFTLEVNRGNRADAIVPHIGLSNDRRTIGFRSIDELIGWLRYDMVVSLSA